MQLNKLTIKKMISPTPKEYKFYLNETNFYNLLHILRRICIQTNIEVKYIVYTI